MITVTRGDCVDVLGTRQGPLFDACVTDPPYHLTSIVKRFGAAGAAEAKVGATGAYARASRGFMGQQWDGGDVAFRVETWRAVFDQMKPGAHLVAFGGTRTFHRLVCAIEDAGFEIRDTLMYCYGSGFPKSHSINKAAADVVCNCGSAPLSQRDVRSVRLRDVSTAECLSDERRQVLQSSMSQPSASAVGRKQLSAAKVWANQPGVEGRGNASSPSRELCKCAVCALSTGAGEYGPERRICDGAPASYGTVDWPSADTNGVCASRRPQSASQCPDELGTMAGQPEPQACGAWPICGECGKSRIPDGIGTALKPALEPICLARKPVAESNIAANVLAHGTGGLNINGCRVETETQDDAIRQRSNAVSMGYGGKGGPRVAGGAIGGRFPANLIHDGSEEVEALFPDRDGATSNGRSGVAGLYADGVGGSSQTQSFADSGSAARFFYSAKAGPLDRLGSEHPTVKPVDVMRWLCRLVTPVGGLILDPFAGSGTTGIAAMAEGFSAELIDLEPKHVADIERKLASLRGEGARVMEQHIKRRAERVKREPSPLFGDAA